MFKYNFNFHFSATQKIVSGDSALIVCMCASLICDVLERYLHPAVNE